MPVKDSYFILYSNCIVVQGYTNAVIYDLQMGKCRYIQPALVQVIAEAKEKSIKDLLANYEKEYHEIILEHFECLVKEGLGFYTDDPAQFPELDLYWDHPALITNAIIDWSNSRNLPLKKTSYFIEQIGCDAIQIIIPSDLKKVEQILKQFEKARVKSIELLANYTSKEHSKKLLSLCEKHLRVTQLCFYKSPNYKTAKGKHNLSIIYSDTPIYVSEFYKIKTDRWPLGISTTFFTESQKHHTYFNRKIYISATGDVKNAPECEEVIGNIITTSIESLIKAIETESNHKYWHVSKDVCDVCKDCELRYMCMDNRVPYQRKDGGWYHKEECNYNPYIGKWQDEEGYQNLRECGIISDENTFFVNEAKMEQVNTSNT